jgi:hypothetical protein
MPWSGPLDSNQVFNNADSFAQAFDEAWQRHQSLDPILELETEATLTQVLGELSDHPFRKSEPELAEQVARFRLRLFGM